MLLLSHESIPFVKCFLLYKEQNGWLFAIRSNFKVDFLFRRLRDRLIIRRLV